MGAIAAVEPDMPGKAFHCSQASVVQETAAPLGQVHNWKLQVPLGESVDVFNHQGRPQKSGVNDSKCRTPVGPLGIAVVVGGGVGIFEAAPDQIESEDDDQNAADPECGEEVVGTLAVQLREIQMLDYHGNDQENCEESGNNKLLSHRFIST